MLIVIGGARALPGRRAEPASAARAVAAQTRDDQGCESYGFYADLTDEDVILGVEVWRDQAALDAHMDHPHTRECLAAAGTASCTACLVAGEIAWSARSLRTKLTVACETPAARATSRAVTRAIASPVRLRYRGLAVGARAPLLISPFRGVHDSEALPAPATAGDADVPLLTGTVRNERCSG